MSCGRSKACAASANRTATCSPPPDRSIRMISLRERVAALLSPRPVSRDEIVRATGAPAPLVFAALVELSLAGRCELLPGGMVSTA
jgi:predicted Rossmann fold nucleotide-binding protein DprA/Smf involved in DNA uptake